MPRPKGSVDATHPLKRTAILDGLRPHLLRPGSQDISFSAMAALAGISIPTLRHYFPRRGDVIAALLDRIGEEGKPYVARVANEAHDDLRESLLGVGRFMTEGVKSGQLSQIHAFGLNEGIGDTVVGPSYLSSILEPTLQAVEARLRRLIEKGAMRDCDVRFASLNFATPILIAFLHQGQLGGECVRPMDVEGLIRQQVETFVAAYGMGDLRGPKA